MIGKMILYHAFRLYTAVHGPYLRVVRGDGYFIDEEKYQRVRQCAFTAFPEEESDYNHCETLDDWLRRIGCAREEIYLLNGETWYLIVIRKFHRIILEQFVSSTKQCLEIPRIFSTLMSLFPNKKIYARCRETTTYQLIQYYKKRGAFKILHDETIIDEESGERYHSIILKTGK